MMEEDIFSNEGQLEDGETGSEEGQALDDATYEPRAYVEQGGDYQQAEDIQASLVDVTESATTKDGDANSDPNSILGPALQEESVGDMPIPVPRPADEGLAEGQPEAHGDLDEATSEAEEASKDEATPDVLPSENELDVPGALPIPNPDEADYYTPNVPGETDTTKKAS